jgi:hypothetical protein
VLRVMTRWRPCDGTVISEWLVQFNVLDLPALVQFNVREARLRDSG